MTENWPPLRDHVNEFRLLKIHPRSHSSSASPVTEKAFIQCSLFPASRRGSGEYLALSYTWGDPNDTVPIHVNNGVRQVTRNLYAALTHIQEEQEEITIWVDAICIDQLNHNEKGEQVRHMTSVYALAKYTIVWLGLPEFGSDAMIKRCIEVGSVLKEPMIVEGEEIQSLADLLAESVSLPNNTAAEKVRYSDVQRNIDIRMGQINEPECSDFPASWLSFLAVFKSLMTRGYWSRVWIHQEVS